MWRPILVRKALRIAFSLNEKMLSYYISILDCPMCVTNLSGFWKVRVTELFEGAISWIRNYGNQEDFRQLLAMPSEVDELVWKPYFLQMFQIYKQRNCHALDIMISERLLEKKFIPRVAQQTEPTHVEEDGEISDAYNVFRGVGRYSWNVEDKPTGNWTWALQSNIGANYI